MRITILSPPFNLSGGHRVKAIYARKLQDRGHEVLIAAPPAPVPGPLDVLRSLARGRGWPRPRPASPSHFDGLGVPLHVLDRHRPVAAADLPDADVVVATWWETAEWAAALPASKGAKVYFIQHHEVLWGQHEERVEATWRLPFHKVVISKWLADLARDRYGDPDYTLVPNSVDQGQFHAPPRGKAPRPTVGLLYSSLPFKGCDVSLRALERASRAVPGIRLRAFGSDPVDPGLPLPPGSDYTVRPAQDALRTIYAECDAWLCGSRGEGFHLPPSEAMACRCPVVSTRVGGPMDLIRDGENGYLVDVEDADALGDRLATVLSLDDASWRAMSDAAYETVRGYTWDDATDLFEAALARAAAARRPTSVGG